MKAYEKQQKNLKKSAKGKDAKAAVVKKTRERGAQRKRRLLAAAGGGVAVQIMPRAPNCWKDRKNTW